jgi:23S rRNA-/tRNA-specific pseudouridylate synthase
VFTPLYRDRHLCVVDKPVGLPVTPPRNGGASVESRTGLRAAHRLDAETSGVLVLGASDEGLARAGTLFAEGAARKVYAAVVTPRPGVHLPDAGRCVLPIGDWQRGRVRVGRGRPATTDWQVIGRDGARCAMIVTPRTGRTHQIRAHLDALGAPIDGDTPYGGAPAARLHLHAWRLALPWEGGTLQLEAPLPAVFDGFPWP